MRSLNLYAVIGYPVRHSLSPATHKAAFSHLKMDADYEAFEVAPADLPKFMDAFRKKYQGMNVTIPHKEAVMKYLDVIDPEATAMGAVNTVLNKNGKLFGYNTDSPGAMMALHEGIGGDFKNFLEDKNVVILGAGGASRALTYGVLKYGGEVTLLNRHIEKAIELVDHFIKIFPRGVFHFGTLDDFDSIRSDIIINTTPVGMSPNDQESPLPNFKEKILEIPHNGHKPKRPLVMDIVYRPRFTRFIRTAQEVGCPIITGERMFLHQAALAFEIWTGQKPPIKVMEEAIMKSLG